MNFVSTKGEKSDLKRSHCIFSTLYIFSSNLKLACKNQRTFWAKNKIYGLSNFMSFTPVPTLHLLAKKICNEKTSPKALFGIQPDWHIPEWLHTAENNEFDFK